MVNKFLAVILISILFVSCAKKQAMEFLYAYMPLSDLADYQPEFFLKNVQLSLKSRLEMLWGKTIPEEEFLHFVLPLRVNNENLDSFREVMYTEIRERIKGMSMKDAAQSGVLKTYKLPSKMEIGIDQSGNLLTAISAIYCTGLKDKLPLVLLCDASGNVYMFSSGYKIGIGEQLLKVIAMVESNLKMAKVKASCSK